MDALVVHGQNMAGLVVVLPRLRAFAGLPDAHGLAVQGHPAHRERIEGANAVIEGAGGQTKIQPRFGLAELVGVGDAFVRLWGGVGQVVLQIVQHGHQQAGALGGQPVVQFAAGFTLADGQGFAEQHGAGIEPGFHLHDGVAGFRVAGGDGPLNRGGPTPARQQRAVHVQAAQAGDVQHRLGNDQPIGHYHQGIQIQVP